MEKVQTAMCGVFLQLVLAVWFSLASGPVGSDHPFPAARISRGAYIAWREHIVDDGGVAGERILGADGLAVGDLDRDGFIDVIAVHEDSSHVRAVFGGPIEVRRQPGWSGSLTLGKGPLVGDCEDVSIGDLDGNGWDDVAVACERGHVVVFFNLGRPREHSGWLPVIVQATRGRGSWIRLAVVDLDGDGHNELVAANKGGTSVSILYPGAQPRNGREWTEKVVWRCRTPINVRPVDLDGDGTLELVAASRGEKRIVCLDRERDTWRTIPIYSGSNPPSEGFMMQFIDLDRDGRLDIITEEDHGGRVFWLQQPARMDGGRWQLHLIGDVSPDWATGLGLADIDGDGQKDLIVGGYSAGPRLHEPAVIRPSDRCGCLVWFKQPERPTELWIRYPISRRRRAMYDMFIPTDLNEDGLVDFLTTRGNSGAFDGVIWIEQIRSTRPCPAFFRARATDSPEVPWPSRERR